MHKLVPRNIYISYYRTNVETADKLCGALDCATLTYFFNSIDNENNGLEKKVLKAIELSECFIFIIDNKVSEYQNKEIEFISNIKGKEFILLYQVGDKSFQHEGIKSFNAVECPIYNAFIDLICTKLGKPTLSSGKITYDKSQKMHLFERDNAELGNSSNQFDMFMWYVINDKLNLKHNYLALYWLEKSAMNGSDVGQYYLGIKYLLGENFDQDTEKALYWLHKSAEQDYFYSLISLGDIYFEGKFIEQDDEKGFYWHKRSADIGCRESQRCVGYYYEIGKGVGQDLQKALYWYRKAADDSTSEPDSEALNDLGNCYFSGIGVEMDYVKAVNYYRQSIKIDDNPNAMRNLAYCYSHGFGVKKDLKKTISLLTHSAKEGNYLAQFELAEYYRKGIGVNIDLEFAAKLYNQAAKAGHLDAMIELSIMYRKGLGLKQDLKKAFRLMRDAARQGDPRAQRNVGINYYLGCGVKKDYSLAVEWFNKSAQQDNIYAMLLLGNCFELGKAVKQNNNTAFSWYVKAFKIEFSCATIVSVADCYYYGIGITKDLNIASYLYYYAAAQDSGDAQYMLAKCYFRGEGAIKDEKQGVSLLRRAAMQGHKYAQNMLSDCYKNGIGVKKNIKRSNFWNSLSLELVDKHMFSRYSCYDYESVNQDYSSEIKLIRREASAGNAYSQNLLGELYKNQDKYKLAFRWWKIAAESDQREALINCISFELDDNIPLKRELYLKSARQGHPVAQERLANLYFSDEFGIQDYKEALYWYECAANNGNFYAIEYIIEIYENGLGVDKDPRKVEYWKSRIPPLVKLPTVKNDVSQERSND